jgi:hypothetical protein
MSVSSRRLHPRAGNFRITWDNNGTTYAVTGGTGLGAGLTISANEPANVSQVVSSSRLMQNIHSIFSEQWTQTGNYIKSANLGYYTAPNNGLSQPGQAIVNASSGYKWFFEIVTG